MGEYIKLDGQHYKLGTCEDLYYVRLEQLQRWIAEGRTASLPGNLEPREYLDGSFRFRFPFPWEDPITNFNIPHGADPVSSQNFDYGFGVSLDAEFGGVEFDHSPIYSHIKAHGGGYGLNVKLPCPQSKEWLSCSVRTEYKSEWEGRSSYIQIVQQRPCEGNIWTVVRCGHCGAKVRLSPSEGTLLAVYLRGRYSDTYPDKSDTFAEIANRIEAGYLVGTESEAHA